MSQQRNIKSRRQQPQGFWQRHKAWVDGLTLGQLIRYRIFQVVVALSITIVAVWAAVSVAWSAFVRPPEIPAVEPDIGDSSTVENTDDLDFGGELPNVAKSGRREGVYTFLLVGQDTGGGGNTDTMMLITFDSVNKELYGMSLPRDTMVNVSTSSKRLNAVYNYNKGSNKETQLEKGIAALKKEVGKLTGIVPDFYVVVQWEAVGELVDAIGGVEFDVPFDMDYDDPAQDLHIHIKGGNQVLDGEDAMGLIRWRHNNDFSVQYPTGDLGRVETQQAFLKAVAEECLDPAIILKAPSLAKIFMDNVTTDLSIGNLLAFAQLAADMDAETGVHFVTMPNQDARYPGVSMVLPVYSELLEVLNDGFNPYLDKITVNDIQVLYRNSDGSYSVTSGTLQDSSQKEVLPVVAVVEAVKHKSQSKEVVPQQEKLEIPASHLPEKVVALAPHLQERVATPAPHLLGRVAALAPHLLGRVAALAPHPLEKAVAPALHPLGRAAAPAPHPLEKAVAPALHPLARVKEPTPHPLEKVETPASRPLERQAVEENRTQLRNRLHHLLW